MGKPSLDGVVTSEETAGTDAGAPVPRRRRTTRTVVAAALAVVLVLAAGGTAWGVTVHNRHVTAQKIADATQADQAAVSTLASDGDAYSSALKTATTAATSITADQVTDPATLTALKALISQSDALLSQVTAATGATVQDGATAADIDSVTAGVSALDGQVVSATQALGSAVKALNDSHDAYLLDQSGKAFDAAAADLNAQVTTSQGVLDGSAGKVTDDSVRQALQASIDAARAAATAAKATTTGAVNAQTKAATDAKADLAAKTQAVTDAQAVWQKAQDDAAAQKSSTSAKSSTSTKSSGTKSSGTKSSSSSSTKSSGSSGSSSSSTGTPHHEVQDDTPTTSTPAQAIAGVTAARTAAGLQTVSSCAAIPGSVESNRGVVHAIAWDSWLTSPDHRAVIMTAAPVHLKAWNGTSTTGTYVIYMQVWACIVPS